MAENNIMGLVGAFIGIAIMLGIGVQILGNSVQDCTTLPDYQIPNSVLSVTITNAGASYETDPSVAFTGGGGSGATGVAVRSGSNTVASVTILTGGESYETAPTVTFSGGGGANATGTAVIGESSIGWAAECESNNTQTRNAYTLLVIILIVVAAVAVLSVIRLLG